MYGVKLKSTKDGKWFWHCNKEGKVNELTKEAAEQRAALWNDEKVAKVAKIPATKKKTKKKAKKKVSKKKRSK